jgi:hypothetical protein
VQKCHKILIIIVIDFNQCELLLQLKIQVALIGDTRLLLFWEEKSHLNILQPQIAA